MGGVIPEQLTGPQLVKEFLFVCWFVSTVHSVVKHHIKTDKRAAVNHN